MGCFSYICKECGNSIREGEGVHLFLVQDGAVLESMMGNYDGYGRVNGRKWANDMDLYM